MHSIATAKKSLFKKKLEQKFFDSRYFGGRKPSTKIGIFFVLNPAICSKNLYDFQGLDLDLQQYQGSKIHFTKTKTKTKENPQNKKIDPNFHPTQPTNQSQPPHFFPIQTPQLFTKWPFQGATNF